MSLGKALKRLNLVESNKNAGNISTSITTKVMLISKWHKVELKNWLALALVMTKMDGVMRGTTAEANIGMSVQKKIREAAWGALSGLRWIKLSRGEVDNFILLEKKFSSQCIFVPIFPSTGFILKSAWWF